MAMRIGKIFLCFIVVLSVSCATTHPNKKYDVIAYINANAQYQKQAAMYREALKQKPEDAPWEREFIWNFDKVIDGGGVVLIMKQDTSDCDSQTNNMYASTDCGFETDIIINVPNALRSDDRIHFSDSTNVLGMTYSGNRHGPGRSGCFGFLKKGYLHVVEVRRDKIVANIKASFFRFNLFKFPTLCADLDVDDQFVFDIQPRITK